MRKINRETLFGPNCFVLFLTVALFIPPVAYAQEASASLEDSVLRSSEASSIPPIIFRQGDKSSYPIWVEASMAFDDLGQLNPSFFIEYDVVAIENYLQIEPEPKTDCIQLENFYIDYIETPDRYNLGEVVESSELVMIARVTESALGFCHATPCTLFAIEKEEVLKGFTDRDQFFVPFPRAEFAVAGHRICKSDTRYAASPKIGDSVLVLLNQYSEPSEPFLYPRFETSLLTLDKDGAVRLPKPLQGKIQSQKSSSLEVDRGDLVDQIRELVAKEGS